MKTGICNFSFDSKHLGMLLVFCMLLNGFVPRVNLELKNYKAACRLAVSGAALVTQFFDLPNLSLKIASDLLRKSRKAKSQTENKQKNTANTSADYSIISFDKKWSIVKYSVPITGGNLIHNAWIQTNIPKFTGKSDCNNSTNIYLFCLFLMFLILLPRGNIKEEIAAILASNIHQKSSPVFAGLDFLFFTLTLPSPTRGEETVAGSWLPLPLWERIKVRGVRHKFTYNYDGGVKCNC